ncbi:MAG: hypothetical protein Q7R35_06095 [Elusimicrobiota bacterium]|nr:hypothetical protein [Elusimicrobiota bacterium]
MEEKSFVRNWLRDTIRNGVRYYSVVDAIAGTVDTKNPRDYWYHIKNRPMDEHDFKLSTLCRQLRLKAKDGKYYLTDCADKAGMRIILSHLPNKDAIPLLRRNRYNIEAIAKTLTGEREHKCENLIGSCRHETTEKELIPRRESPAAARARKKAQDAKSASLHSADLLDRLDRILFPFLKSLYPLP